MATFTIRHNTEENPGVFDKIKYVEAECVPRIGDRVNIRIIKNDEDGEYTWGYTNGEVFRVSHQYKVYHDENVVCEEDGPPEDDYFEYHNLLVHVDVTRTRNG